MSCCVGAIASLTLPAVPHSSRAMHTSASSRGPVVLLKRLALTRAPRGPQQEYRRDSSGHSLRAIVGYRAPAHPPYHLPPSAPACPGRAPAGPSRRCESSPSDLRSLRRTVTVEDLAAGMHCSPTVTAQQCKLALQLQRMRIILPVLWVPVQIISLWARQQHGVIQVCYEQTHLARALARAAGLSLRWSPLVRHASLASLQSLRHT